MCLVTNEITNGRACNQRQRTARILCCGIFILVCLAFPGTQNAMAQPGDFDGDMVLTSADANLLTTEIFLGTNGATYDLDGDTLVTLVDLHANWFPLYSAASGVPVNIARIDLNFDMTNTAADFQILESNLSSNSSLFTSGDLDANGVVDALDRQTYLNLGGAVPEPSSVILLLTAITCGLTQRRRK